MLTITAVAPRSIGAKLKLKKGDRIVRINGQTIRDMLDFHYYIADDFLELAILKEASQETVTHEVAKEYDDDLGLSVAEMTMKSCGSDCIFCFVDQNPAGMRQSLYFRDGDYRFSFLQGHFVTLNNVGPKALERIVTQQLSPINVSVHVTDPELRVRMTGHPKAGLLMDKIRYLTAGGIQLHTQIVLCPGINDGDYLKRSIEDLVAFYPQVETLSVVPVGVTKYQKNKALQNRIDARYARDMLDYLDRCREHLKEKLGVFFVHPSDEWFLLAGRDFPDAEAYEDFPQYENGVGMCRVLIDEMEDFHAYLPTELPEYRRATIITGTLAGPVLKKHVAGTLNHVDNFYLDVLPVVNDFYGDMVTVSGLLVGQDIRQALADKREELGDIVLLPPDCLNDDDLFLDDLTIADLQAVVPERTKIELASHDTLQWIEQLLGTKLENSPHFSTEEELQMAA